jgi:hypothetical protein
LEKEIERLFSFTGEDIVGPGIDQDLARMGGGSRTAENNFCPGKSLHGTDESLDEFEITPFHAEPNHVWIDFDELLDKRSADCFQVLITVGSWGARLQRKDNRFGQTAVLGPTGDFEHAAGPAVASKEDPDVGPRLVDDGAVLGHWRDSAG